ncbi:MAG: LysR family transcriptional regulator [Burkholderiales bacterium]|nr:LysR family transcriptional regulator [Burkholderiales bacterium]
MTIRFKLRQLEMFIAVAEELNFRVAAERLHMTQPPLSRQIRELEEGLNLQLFDRASSGVSLTELGKQFLPEARALIATCEELAARYSGGENREMLQLKIGVTTVVEVETYHQLPAFLETAMPNCKIEFRPQTTVRSIQDVLKNRLDAAIIGMPSKIDKLNTRKLYRDPLCLALPANHRLANSERVSLLALTTDALFWFKRELNPGFYDYCESAFARMGYAPQRLPEPTDHHVLLSMIANQGGVALIPCSMRNLNRTGVVYREIEEQHLLYIDVAIAYGETAQNPILARFVEEMTAFFQVRKSLA